jgi:hypothetical protein
MDITLGPTDATTVEPTRTAEPEPTTTADERIVAAPCTPPLRG